MQKPEIFISYAWGGESEKIVDVLYDTFVGKGYNVVRDKVNLGFKGSITSFMDRIGQGKYVIVVISDKYIKSENCMYEIVQIAKNGQFHDRIFPIVLSDANFYKPVNRVKYISHWENQKKELNESMKSLDDMSMIAEIQKELANYNEIHQNISNILFVLKDMNTLTPEMHQDSHFEAMFEAIDKKIALDNSQTVANTKDLSTKNTETPTHSSSTNMTTAIEQFKKECQELIDELQYNDLFEKIKNSGYNYSKPYLAQFRQQYATGHISFQFPDQLKVFVNGIKEK